MSEAVAGLDARLQRLVDVTEISQMVSSYGPAAEAIDYDYLQNFWHDDAFYDLDGGWIVSGKSEILAGYKSDAHRQMVVQGCAHLGTAPVIAIDGDRASSTHHVAVVVNRASGFAIHRVVVARWEFRRSPSGRWITVSRTLRDIGRPGAAELLANAHKA